ncbi:MAG: hypothetical protein BWK77_04770 [Verrucomicrobia bacterium A1]|nr:MAG: hypothetical protein BWK77_04770 [Verrucomicrobia bacterium A1]
MAGRTYQHIIWDWNGTLFNDAWLCMDVMNGLLRRRGLPLLTLERYQQLFDFPVINYYRQLGFDFSKESFEDLGTEFIADYERRRLECGLREEARAVLEGIRAAGMTQSVLSAYKKTTLEDILAHFDVRPFFVRAIGSDDHYASGKVEQGRKWIRELGCEPGQALLIGDTTHDHEVAEAMGTGCWLIPGGNHSRARLETCGVPVLDSLRDVMKRLDT